MSGPRISSRIAALISRFRRDSGANIAVIFAIALVPIITMIGCATDYSLAVRMKAKMQSAADGASVASISQNSAGYLAATQMTTDGSVPAGVAEANNIFTGNVNGTGGYQSLSVTSTVTKTRAALRSNVQFSAQVPTIFLNIIGYQYLTISGSSSASASLPLYLDFYLMLDVSGSMGLPSTDAEQTRLSAINPVSSRRRWRPRRPRSTCAKARRRWTTAMFHPGADRSRRPQRSWFRPARCSTQSPSICSICICLTSNTRARPGPSRSSTA